MHSDSTTEQHELEALRDSLLAGDGLAFEKTFRRLRSVIGLAVRGDIDAEDIVSETFLVLHRRIQARTIISTDRRASAPGAPPVVISDWRGLTLWLKQVARNIQKAYWRKHVARAIGERSSDASSMDEDTYQRRDSLMSVMEYVAEHDPDKLWLLQSRFIFGLSWEEIAEDPRATSLGAAKMAVSRLRQSIRQEFENAV